MGGAACGANSIFTWRTSSVVPRATMFRTCPHVQALNVCFKLSRQRSPEVAATFLLLSCGGLQVEGYKGERCNHLLLLLLRQLLLLLLLLPLLLLPLLLAAAVPG